MTLQMIECFLAAAETRSFSQTARQLYISQPAVSKYVHQLETELHVQLFDRSNRRAIVLTEDGKAIYQSLIRCRQDFSETLRSITDQKLTKPITINLVNGFTPSFSITNAFESFMERHERTLYTHYIDYPQMAQALEAGEFIICEDIAVPPFPPFTSCEKQVIADSILPYKLVVSRNHPVLDAILAPSGDITDRPIPPSIFSGIPLLLSKTMPDYMIAFYQEMTQKYLGKMSGCHMTDTQEETMWALHFGRGLTILPGYQTNRLDENYLSFDLPTPSSYCILWKPDRMENPLFKEILPALK